MVGPSLPDVGRKPVRCDCCSGSCDIGPSLAYQAAADIDQYGRVIDEEQPPGRGDEG